MKFRGSFSSSKRITSRKKGFAIVMALSLLSLVFLLVISLVNLVGIDLSLADARKQRVLAQAHARMGMMVAIGELQKHLGPDTRVSATADILDERIESGVKYESKYYSNDESVGINEAVTSNQAIDLNENDELDTVPFGQRYWTGVWKNRACRLGDEVNDMAAGQPLPLLMESGNTIDQLPAVDTGYDPHPAIEVAWLVSGNEGWSRKLAVMGNPFMVGDFIEIQDRDDEVKDKGFDDGGVYGLDKNPWLSHQLVVANELKKYHHPLVDLADPDESDESVWILKRPLMEGKIPEGVDPSYWKNQLRGEPVKVQKTFIKPRNSNTDRLHTHGSYAYWVGDEGIKTRVNLNKPKDLEMRTEQEKMDNLSIATFPNILFQKVSDVLSGGFGLDFLDELIPSNLLSLGILAKEESDLTDDEYMPRKLAAHYHSMTTSSYGVLADVRTGGLKRDLSHAFVKTDELRGNYDFSKTTPRWAKDFRGFLYNDKVQVYKNFPMDPNAKANIFFMVGVNKKKKEKHPEADMIDDSAALAGPHWRTLATFHNLYHRGYKGEKMDLSKPAIKDHEADSFPRYSGDNYVLFDADSGYLPNSNNTTPFWEKLEKRLGPTGNPRLFAISSKLNYFDESPYTRPGSVRHAIHPVLMELKYSQVPTVENGNISLAMYPSFALWNPYDVAIEMDELFVEVPLSGASLHCFNPKEYDRWRKWFIWAFNPQFGVSGGGGKNKIPPTPKYPPGFPNMGRRGAVGLPGSMGAAGYFYSFVLANAPHPNGDYNHPRLSLENPYWNFNRFHDYLTQRRLNDAHWHSLGPSFNFIVNDSEGNPVKKFPVDKRFEAHHYEPLYPWYNFNFLGSNHPVSGIDNLNWRGEYVEDTIYVLDDAVLWQGRQYACIYEDGDVIDKSPNNNPYYWELIQPKTKERHLLLELKDLRLEPGQKAHFIPKDGQVWDYKPHKKKDLALGRQYLKVKVEKSTSQKREKAFICRTKVAVADLEPWLAVENALGNIQGVHQSQVALYKADGQIMDNQQIYPEPKGICMYHKDPTWAPVKNSDQNYLFRAHRVDLRKPIFRCTKSFDTNVGHGAWTILVDPLTQLSKTKNQNLWTKRARLYQEGDKLNASPPVVDAMPGNGFRIRFQLPGYSDKVVLEQFNLRALVRSFQDGFGDNWKTEKFNGSHFAGMDRNPLTEVYDKDYTLLHELGKTEFRPRQMKFVDFFAFRDGDSSNVNIADFNETYPLEGNKTAIVDRKLSYTDVISNYPVKFQNLDTPFGMTVPRIESTPLVGMFHDSYDQHGNDNQGNPLRGVDRAVLFEVPKAPMLSLLQLRHANLSEYDHSPSYILGNSYAPTQVGRYYPWGRVRAITKEFDNETYIRSITKTDWGKPSATNWTSHEYYKQAFSSGSSPWEWWLNEENIAFENPYAGNKLLGYTDRIRDVDAQNEHQNTTLDHSYYANRALLDGYFMSGVGLGSGNNSDFNWRVKTEQEINLGLGEELAGIHSKPYRNKRLIPFLRNNEFKETSYAKLAENVAGDDEDFRYQTLASDLLLEGAFNLNSTSVDAWISILTSLKSLPIPNGSYPTTETPIIRFLKQPITNQWNTIRSLSDDEILKLAHCLVEQIKLRGPFLSTADFVNRRLQGPKNKGEYDYPNLITTPLNEWDKVQVESRLSTVGLRGTVQAAIAEAKLNHLGKADALGSNVYNNPAIPTIPEVRYTPQYPRNRIKESFPFPSFMYFKTGTFGMHAVSRQLFLEPASLNQTWLYFNDDHDTSEVKKDSMFGRGSIPPRNLFQGFDANGKPYSSQFEWKWPFEFYAACDDYTGATSFGEAPENLLAVEDVATAANKPDWVMQADVLSPIIPVSNVRSDTFMIRVMGEPKSDNVKNLNKNRAWIELTVQRTPDYVKSELDAPHHRPHEPFEDINLNGYWDDGSAGLKERWIDLNQNEKKKDGSPGITVPDLPGGGPGMQFYRDGLGSDIQLNADEEEEDAEIKYSRMGINQRFGRKFKIIKFRWIKGQDV